MRIIFFYKEICTSLHFGRGVKHNGINLHFMRRSIKNTKIK